MLEKSKLRYVEATFINALQLGRRSRAVSWASALSAALLTAPASDPASSAAFSASTTSPSLRSRAAHVSANPAVRMHSQESMKEGPGVGAVEEEGSPASPATSKAQATWGAVGQHVELCGGVCAGQQQPLGVPAPYHTRGTVITGRQASQTAMSALRLATVQPATTRGAKGQLPLPTHQVESVEASPAACQMASARSAYSRSVRGAAAGCRRGGKRQAGQVSSPHTAVLGLVPDGAGLLAVRVPACLGEEAEGLGPVGDVRLHHAKPQLQARPEPLPAALLLPLCDRSITSRIHRAGCKHHPPDARTATLASKETAHPPHVHVSQLLLHAGQLLL